MPLSVIIIRRWHTSRRERYLPVLRVVGHRRAVRLLRHVAARVVSPSRARNLVAGVEAARLVRRQSLPGGCQMLGAVKLPASQSAITVRPGMRLKSRRLPVPTPYFSSRAQAPIMRSPSGRSIPLAAASAPIRAMISAVAPSPDGPEWWLSVHRETPCAAGEVPVCWLDRFRDRSPPRSPGRERLGFSPPLSGRFDGLIGLSFRRSAVIRVLESRTNPRRADSMAAAAP